MSFNIGYGSKYNTNYNIHRESYTSNERKKKNVRYKLKFVENGNY